MVLIVIFLKRKDDLLGSTFFAISFFLGITELGTEFYDKLTVALCILAIVVSALAYSPITFATKSIYADFRTNTTSSDDLIIVVRYANKDYTREAKLAGAVFIHTIIAATGTFFFIAMFFIWPEDILNLLDTIYVLEDTSRMFSPILLILFSKPLRIAFIQTYWKVKSFNITSTNAKTLTTPRIQASKITIVASTKQIATRF
uniref:Uncharacterized protein n=1 Tax=Acrobeloides nanus TaxID=290746 RepID=A0A914DQQ2_9BILA